MTDSQTGADHPSTKLKRPVAATALAFALLVAAGFAGAIGADGWAIVKALVEMLR